MKFKKYKNTLISLGFYLSSFIWYFLIAPPFIYHYPATILISSILALVGIFFAFKNVKEIKVIWLSDASLLVGLIILLGSVLMFILETSAL